MDRRFVSAGLLTAALAASACAPAAASRASDARFAAAGAHVYRRPAPEVEAAVRAELAAEGFIVAPPSEDGLVRTDWKVLIDGREFATVRERYVILVKRLTARHARVEALRISMSTLGSDISRPLKMFVPADVNDKTASYTIYGEGPERPSLPRAVQRDLAFEWRLLARIECVTMGPQAAPNPGLTSSP